MAGHYLDVKDSKILNETGKAISERLQKIERMSTNLFMNFVTEDPDCDSFQLEKWARKSWEAARIFRDVAEDECEKMYEL